MSDRSAMVRERWGFLADCLRSAARPSSGAKHCATAAQSSPLFSSSVRRFHSFDLFEREPLVRELDDEEDEEEEEEDEEDFVTYAADCPISGRRLRIALRLHRQLPSLAELQAFNNTGNVCLWPSEECLAWFLLEAGRPRPGFSDVRSVLELGSGQAGLAGLVCALFWPGLDCVLLTDGNERCVSNLARVLELNYDRLAVREAASMVLRWPEAGGPAGAGAGGPTSGASFDLILCADCFFFEEGHAGLLDTIVRLLEPRRGRCLCVAPERSGSFELFRQRAARRLPTVRRLEPFSNRVRARQEQLERCEAFEPDLHLPKMLLLSRSKEPL